MLFINTILALSLSLPLSLLLFVCLVRSPALAGSSAPHPVSTPSPSRSPRLLLRLCVAKPQTRQDSARAGFRLGQEPQQQHQFNFYWLSEFCRDGEEPRAQHHWSHRRLKKRLSFHLSSRFLCCFLRLFVFVSFLFVFSSYL